MDSEHTLECLILQATATGLLITYKDKVYWLSKTSAYPRPYRQGGKEAQILLSKRQYKSLMRLVQLGV